MWSRVKKYLWRLLTILGWIQLNLLLGLLFFLVLTPYALFLRVVFRMKFLPSGSWSPVEKAATSLDSMRRSY